MKKKKVILCDQDGVLIDKTYSCNYSFDGLNGLLLENNAIIVPHSDTPVQRLRNNFELFAGIKIGTLPNAERSSFMTTKKSLL